MSFGGSDLKTTVYLDVLFLLNLFVSYLLLKATARMINIHTSKGRMIAGSLLGGLYSLIILFEIDAWLLVILKVVMGASLVVTVFFRRGEWRRFLKISLCFFLANFLFAGFMLALWLFAPMEGMQFKNGVAYFDISAMTLAFSTTVAYLIITLFSRLWNKRTGANELSELRISLFGREVTMTAFADSGNKLSDIFSGLPVIVCEYDAVAGLFPEKLKGFFESPTDFSFDGLESSSLRIRLKMIPIQMAAGEGTLPAVKPDSIAVNGSPRTAVIAVTREQLSDGGFQAILNPALLE